MNGLVVVGQSLNGLVRVGQTDDVDQPWWDKNERTDFTGTKRPNELVTVGHVLVVRVTLSIFIYGVYGINGLV